MEKTALFESHQKLGARFIGFAGYRLPFCYEGGAVAEHLSARRGAALFDISHIGRLRVAGSGVLDFLSRLLPSDIRPLKAGEGQYSALLNERGGMIDDLLVYRMEEEAFLLCVNAAAKGRSFAWVKDRAMAFDVKASDETKDWSLVALQGPDALKAASRWLGEDFSSLKRFSFVERQGRMLARAGWTGEDGLEIYSPSENAAELWDALIEAGARPAGLGARDTLRLEMGYLLSGTDFDETRSLRAARLSWLQKNPADHIGKRPNLPEKARLEGFVLEQGAGVPRRGAPVLSAGGRLLGHVSSGARSPSLEKMIGLAYIDKSGLESGLDGGLFVEIHGERAAARLCGRPFLRHA